MDFLYEIDKSLLYLINVEGRSPFLSPVMEFVTDFKNWKIPIAALVALHLLWMFFAPLFRGGPVAEGFLGLKRALTKGFVFLAVVGVGLGAGDFLNHEAVKPFFGRTRPCNELTDISITAPCNRSYSFTSSHAVNITALAAIMSYEYRLFSPVIIGVALLVCYSRVYLGMHYPFDVLAGIFFGLFYGGGAVYLKVRLFRWKERRKNIKHKFTTEHRERQGSLKKQIERG